LFSSKFFILFMTAVTKDSNIVTEAFIKVLDAGVTWATTQQIYELLTVGAHSITLLNVDPALANPVVQVGFRVISGNDPLGTGGSAAETS
jgi:hypothetical protein